MAFLKVLDEPWLHGTPTQQLLCLGDRGREVLREQDPDETEVFDRLLRRYGSNRHVQMPADHLAIWRTGTPSSATPFSRAAAGADCSARQCRCAASSRCAAGQRLDPSPG